MSLRKICTMAIRRGNKVVSEKGKLEKNKEHIIMIINIFCGAISVACIFVYILTYLKPLRENHIIYAVYIFTCAVIAYISILIYSYKIIKLEKKYAFKEYKLNPHHKSNDSTQRDGNENSQSKDNQGGKNKSVKQESNETEENAKNADTVAETAQITEAVDKSDETQQSSQEDK